MRSILRHAASLAALSFAATLHAADAPRDPVEGRWLGTIGPPRERVAAGLEFVRDAGSGELKLDHAAGHQFIRQRRGRAGGARRRPRRGRADPPFARAEGRPARRPLSRPEQPRDVRTRARAAAAARSAEGARRPRAALAGAPRRAGVRVAGRADGIAYVGTTGGVFNAVDTRDGNSCGRTRRGARLRRGHGHRRRGLLRCDDGELHKLSRATASALALRPRRRAASRVLPHPAVYDWDWHAPKPLVDGDLVVVGDADGGVTPSMRRTERGAGVSIRAAGARGAAVAGTRVVVGSDDHFAHSLDRETGREAWRYDTGAPIETRPLVQDGRVLIGNRGSGLYAIDAETGEEPWRRSSGARGSSRPRSSSTARSTSAHRTRAGSARSIRPTAACSGAPTCSAGPSARRWSTATDPRRRRGRRAVLHPPPRELHRARPQVRPHPHAPAIPDPGGHQWGIVGSLARSDDTVVYATLSGSLYGIPRR